MNVQENTLHRSHDWGLDPDSEGKGHIPGMTDTEIYDWMTSMSIMSLQRPNHPGSFS